MLDCLSLNDPKNHVGLSKEDCDTQNIYYLLTLNLVVE